MHQLFSLRQVEVFKAVIEHGTATRAAEALNILQFAISKLLFKFEQETKLTLFERTSGRLIPTQQGMRLYEEIDRILIGLHQIEQAVETIKRDDQKKLNVGVMPALSGVFIRQVVSRVFKKHPDIEVSIHVRSSQYLVDWLASQQIDVALVSANIQNPHITQEPIIPSPLVCALPKGHPLTEKRVIRTQDLDNEPFIAFEQNTRIENLVRRTFQQAHVTLNTVVSTSAAPTLCEFVREGLGVSLVHPIFTEGMSNEIVLRKFLPDLYYSFLLCRNRISRNPTLIDTFVDQTRDVADEFALKVKTIQEQLTH